MVPFQTIPPSESFGRSEFFDSLSPPFGGPTISSSGAWVPVAIVPDFFAKRKMFLSDFTEIFPVAVILPNHARFSRKTRTFGPEFF